MIILGKKNEKKSLTWGLSSSIKCNSNFSEVSLTPLPFLIVLVARNVNMPVEEKKASLKSLTTASLNLKSIILLSN